MQIDVKSVPKERRFFEYLLELTKLTGKVVRDYHNYEKYWDTKELREIDGCFVEEQLENEELFLEIHKPHIRQEELVPPMVNDNIKEWLDFIIRNENSIPNYKSERRFINEHGEEIVEIFNDDIERVGSYNRYISDWDVWAQNLKKKRKIEKLYDQFFELVSRFDREGESLEFVYGRGILTWNHPDRKVGYIRSPLLTNKLTLELDAERGVITARRVDDTTIVEREMLSGVSLPNKNKLEEIFNSLKSRDIKDDISDLLTQLVHTIDAKGEYKNSIDGVSQTHNSPVIYDKSVFILRVKKTRVLRDDLQNIIEQIDTGNLEINDVINSIIDSTNGPTQNDPVDNNSIDSKLPNNELFFPLPYNEQQKEIINRINRNYGVTVQGPPGTGKTHTIANLVSHFLAEGKRVLITSQKENPLKVLKEKIPKEIQDLCVPVLGGGKDSLHEIERSINTISEKLGELDTEKLDKNVNLALKELDDSKRKESKLVNQLKDYHEKEGTVLSYKGEELFRYDVAKQLANSDINYEWILDDVDMQSEFPLNEVEFKELWNYREKLTADELSLNFAILPRVDIDLRNEKDFEELVNEGQELVKTKFEGSRQLEFYQLPEDTNKVDEIISSLKTILDYENIIEHDSYKLVLNELYAGGIREERWRNLVNSMKNNCERLFQYYNDLITHSINLPEKPYQELKEDISLAKQRLEEGKKPNLAFLLFKGKQTKYLFKNPVLDDRPLSTLEDFGPLEDFVNYQQLKLETSRIFNANMKEINQSIIDQQEPRFPHILEERLVELEEVIKVFEVIKSVEEKLSIDFAKLNSIEYVKKLLENIKLARKYLEYKTWDEKYQEELSQLKLFGSNENAHPIIHEFIEAFENKDSNKWSKLLNKLLGLYDKKKEVGKFYELLNKMNDVLPLTKKSIEISIDEDWDYPENYLKSFELKKLRTWLDETKDISVSKIKKLIDIEKNKQSELIIEIVRDATWKNQIERITDKEKRALSSWKSYIKRFGKGTGKYAKQYLRNARESMKDAQSAIPVWIMPITQVLENFPITNEKFDVIIFDESSQCDIFSANVLLRGEKIIVVGDDEQISPQAIGIKQDDVNELVNRYLYDIPNSDLFDGNISLYEIAEQTFPKEGKLMLREHFRCVPEIIQFSNDLSYGGEMIPLRLPLEEEKLEPPVMAIKINDGYNDEKEKDINLPEAEAIANDIYEIVHDSKYNNQTIGVIALQGNKQHKLIEKLVRDKIGDAEYVARKIICGNPYDLQGDERDIIFLSMVVAPNRNFRRLSMSSEKQRFNVAASRAKNQMRLYHSVDTNDLDSSDYRYALLSYCKNPTRVNEEIEDLEQLCDSPFEVDVLRMILAKGYKVKPQVKAGGYRIDFVIEGIRDRLAVECDGEKWHGPEKFEEDMIRQESLERAGWKFWRIRGREFYLNRKEAMESLWEKLEEMGIEPGA